MALTTLVVHFNLSNNQYFPLIFMDTSDSYENVSHLYTVDIQLIYLLKYGGFPRFFPWQTVSLRECIPSGKPT